jgi:hypothetical protein
MKATPALDSPLSAGKEQRQQASVHYTLAAMDVPHLSAHSSSRGNGTTSNLAGSYNTVIGDSAVYYAQGAAAQNTAVGYQALYANTTGSNWS